MKYARIERERRFLLPEVPFDVSGADWRRIEDHYIEGTRLRLRLMTDADGTVVARKLGQKVSIDPRAVKMTNIYLDGAEYDRLVALGGHRLVKRRYRWPRHEGLFCVDVFEGALAGLILAEIECVDDASLDAVGVPEGAIAEVTEDRRFEGGALAVLGREAALALRLKWSEKAP